jgi:hypothetical protein
MNTSIINVVQIYVRLQYKLIKFDHISMFNALRWIEKRQKNDQSRYFVAQI